MPHLDIPIALTSFIGRKREMAEVSRLLGSSRIVTLTGAGGCGKTRLALRLAADSSRSFADGVDWVELAPLANPALLPQAVARALKVVEQPGRPLVDGLLESLHTKQLLLVLDNCEHLLTACAELVEALMSAPHVKILTTSREPLGVTGEALYPVSPLSLPPASLDYAEMGQFEAVQLFVDRARAILPDFALTPENGAAIAAICRHLDGIPLAIELASTRVNVLTVEQIAARLDARFDLLVSTSRRSDGHHRTLRAAIDWSYDLLSTHEQTVLRRLSVFPAGCGLETAETVCSGGEIRREQMLDLMSSLVNKSLLAAETLQRGEARYHLLETIRQYGQEKLRDSEEWPLVCDRYVQYFLELTEETAPKLRGQYQTLWLNWLASQHDNIRAALTWSLESQRIESGLRIANALNGFWSARGYVSEGRAWFERLLAQADETIPLAVHVNALTFTAFLCQFLGDAPATMACGRKAVALCEAAGEVDKALLAFALAGLGSGAQASGDYQTLYDLGERTIPLYRELADSYSLGMSLFVHGLAATALARYDAAHTRLDESLSLAQEAGDTQRIAITLNAIGNLARCQHDYARAQPAYEESVSLLRELGAARDLAGVLHNLAHVCLHRGNAERAQALFSESLAIQRNQGNVPGIAECLMGFAALAVADGLPAAGARLLAAAMRDGVSTWPAERMEYDHYRALIRAALTEDEFEAEQAAGRALTIEQAIDYAQNLPFLLRTPPEPPLGGLTVREREVAALIAQGKSNSEMADEWVVSKRTVEKHVANILSKLGFTNRAQIVRWAIENGLVKPSG